MALVPLEHMSKLTWVGVRWKTLKRDVRQVLLAHLRASGRRAAGRS